MHRRMDELVGRVGTLEASTAAVQEDITEMKPITDDVRKWKLMGMGALAVIGIGAALGVTIADVVKRDLAVLLRGVIRLRAARRDKLMQL